MGLTWLGIVVIAILLLMGYSGYRRGFIKEILSFFFVFLAVALAGVFNPGVSAFSANHYAEVTEFIYE